MQRVDHCESPGGKHAHSGHGREDRKGQEQASDVTSKRVSMWDLSSETSDTEDNRASA